jgi:hypothetical protein
MVGKPYRLMNPYERAKHAERCRSWSNRNKDKVRESSKRSNRKRRSDPDKVVKIRDYQVKYRESNRRELAAKERERRFGISHAEYATLYSKQNGKCAICKKSETQMRNGRIKSLAVDHCHSTGRIRGLLCAACNQAIGKFGDDITTLENAISYLKSGRE